MRFKPAQSCSEFRVCVNSFQVDDPSGVMLVQGTETFLYEPLAWPISQPRRDVGHPVSLTHPVPGPGKPFVGVPLYARPQNGWLKAE